MMRFLATNQYHGPVNLNPPPDHRMAARVEFKSSDPAISVLFPDFVDGLIISGNRALKCHAIIIRHEQSHTGDITDGFRMIAPGLVRCTPELLPVPIQISLLTFINHLSSIRTDVSIDPVFHVMMYTQIATKYMLDELKPLIVDAFRWGTQAWIRHSKPVYCSLITAARIILNSLLTPGMGAQEAAERDWDMANALVQILADNWGWMRHEREWKDFMAEKKSRPLKVTVEKRVAFIEKFWKRKLAGEA
ncbi:hypothetical protein P280DRAFT_326972 [Massarina eburnea CBS 473.64]|uniref:Uncharacterized protein n=1 Tax=Massarina eburnea CBS 473.64 TaxID=1395130 RepID=A0A6A6RZU1_9PLEO|nr:hypothetical protein P280DRAFT_326972 [Massarina eburnea CBS 473.64]